MSTLKGFNVVLLICMLLLSGCTSNPDTEDDHNFIAQDHSAMVEDGEELFEMWFNNGTELEWTSIVVELSMVYDDGGTSNWWICDNPSKPVTNTGGPSCSISVPNESAKADYWEKDEIILVSDENDLCSADCTINIRITYDNDVLGELQLLLM